jgi:hypothetical protein
MLDILTKQGFSSTQLAPASQLTQVIQDMNAVYAAILTQLIRDFFEDRGSPVMHRAAPGTSSATVPPAPVVKPDGQVYEADVAPELRWYIVTRGRSVGVVQGE